MAEPTFAQAQAAMSAMIAKATQPPAVPVAIAIVDSWGNLVAYAHMDKLRAFPKRHCFRTAYTSAITGRDSAANAEGLKQRGLTVSEWTGDPNMTPGQGGVAVNDKDGVTLGGIGVGGYPSGEDDEKLARVGLTAMGL